MSMTVADFSLGRIEWQCFAGNRRVQTPSPRDTPTGRNNSASSSRNIVSREKVVEHFYRYDDESSTRNLTDGDQNVTDTFIYPPMVKKWPRTGTKTNPFEQRSSWVLHQCWNRWYLRAGKDLWTSCREWLSVDPGMSTAKTYMGLFRGKWRRS